MERLMTLKEVCEVFKNKEKSGAYVRGLRAKGLIEGAMFGNRLLFKESSIQRFIDEQFELQNKKSAKRRSETKNPLNSSAPIITKGE